MSTATAEIVTNLTQDLDNLIASCEKGDLHPFELNSVAAEFCEQAESKIVIREEITDDHRAQVKERFDKIEAMENAVLEEMRKSRTEDDFPL